MPKTVKVLKILKTLDNISKYLELKKEFSNWDKLSDEALIDFEKQLWKERSHFSEK